MTLNCIWWWGSTSEVLESVEYSFISITPMSTLTQSGRVLSMGQIDLIENYSYLILPRERFFKKS